MKTALLTVALLLAVGLATHDVGAQVYSPYYYYGPYDDGAAYGQQAQQANPYYLLEVIHYQLYLPYHQYPLYQWYQPCCIARAVILPSLPPAVTAGRGIIVNPRATRRR